MNNLRNSVTIIGNLGQDPTVLTLDGGRQMSRLSLATTEYYKNRDGEKTTETQWHNCVAFGQTGETINRYAKKGHQLTVRGKIQYRAYTDKNGIERKATQIKVDEVLLQPKSQAAAS